MKKIIYASNKKEIFKKYGRNASIERVLNTTGSQENTNFVVKFNLWIPKF